MQLKEAIEMIWQNRKYDTSSETEAVSHLNEEVAESLKALLRGDKERAQAELEDAMSCLFIAMKVLNINPEEVVFRQIDRMKNQPVRTMHIYSNRVEIKVGDEIKGGWAIWSADDLKEAQKMAREFKCKIIKETENQFENTDNKEINANAKSN
jgi:phosphoribosyl-ATP pyrophosphohydrolase